MPGALPPDDALAPLAEEVRFAVGGPPPAPSRALAAVLAGGFSNPYDIHQHDIHQHDIHQHDKGDLLVTAGSDVHGPAPQAAGPPNWKEDNDMPVTGIFAALLAKLAGAGTTAKAALAGVTAVTTMGLAGGAAGVLPGPAQTLVASAVNATTPFEFPGAGGATAVVERVADGLAGLPATTPTVGSGPSASANVAAGVAPAPPATSGSAATAAAPAVTTPTVPGLPALPTSLPQVTVPPAAAGLVNGLPACVRNLVPAGGATPDPAALAAGIPGCITQVLAAPGLAPDVARCVASVLGTIGGASGMSAAAVPGLPNLDMATCVPMDTSSCVNSMLGLLATLPGAGAGLPDLANLAGLGGVAGCAPMSVQRCISSITASAATGTAPRFDLSTCVPATPATPAVPGIGSLPGVGGLPGLGGALPFFGR